MTVKQIIGECLVRMGLDNFINNQSYTADEQKLADRLVLDLNIVYRQIVARDLPLVASADIEIENGSYSFSSLTGVRFLYPVRLEVGDSAIKYRTYATSIKCDYSGSAKLFYAYLPSTDFALTDSIDDVRVTPQVLCAGILAEYYLQNKVFDLARNYDDEFRGAMAEIKYKGRSMFLKDRRW